MGSWCLNSRTYFGEPKPLPTSQRHLIHSLVAILLSELRSFAAPWLRSLQKRTSEFVEIASARSTYRQRRRRSNPTTMRVMVIVKANKDSESGVLPDKEILAKMGKDNEELAKAGIMLAGEGLQASAKGKRVKFSGTKRTITDGPFTETKELIAGFWLWK